MDNYKTNKQYNREKWKEEKKYIKTNKTHEKQQIQKRTEHKLPTQISVSLDPQTCIQVL